MTTLSVVVPCYNSAAYMRRCLDSLLTVGPDVEVLVIDDGSTDTTAQIADEYAAAPASNVSVVRKPNGGHGSAINAGLARAAGRYLKIVDSDDWVDEDAFGELLVLLRGLEAEPVDMVISNFVYEKVGKKRKTVVGYADVLPSGRVFGWGEVGSMGKRQYLLMHALVYRTDLLREVGLELPEHTFYVDNLYAFAPLPRVRSMIYLDVDLYRYYIGRDDQSVAEKVMMQRIDQQLLINTAMIRHVPRAGTVPEGLVRYMEHYLEIVCAVSSTLLIKMGTADAMAKKHSLWREIRSWDPDLYSRLRWRGLSVVTNLPGKPGRHVTRIAYWAAQRAVGFN